MKDNGNPLYLAEACANGYFNGCVPGKNGPEMPQKPVTQDKKDLDRPRYGSRAGLLNKKNPG